MKNLSLRAKLLLLSFFLASVSMAIGGISYWGLQRVVRSFSTIAEVNYPNTSNILQMLANFRLARLEANNLATNTVSAEEKKKSLELIEHTFQEHARLEKAYLAVDFRPGEEAIYAEFSKAIAVPHGYIREIAELYKTKPNDAAAHEKMAQLAFHDIPAVGGPVRDATSKLTKFHFAAAESAMHEANEEARESNILMLATVLIGGAVGLILSVLFSNGLVKLLRGISESLDQASTQVSAAADQIAKSSDGLSQATSEQAASLEETSASIEELSSMVAQNSDNAKNTASTSISSKTKAEHGRSVVDEMINSMTQINDSTTNVMTQVNQSNERMSEIIKVIQEIENKTKVINDIVFQTKLLSFNASVEAARAGEQGKGFAVVAEEVGNLAQMSGNAAREIAEMLASSIQKVETIANETKSKVEGLIADGQEKVKTGSNIARQCGEVLTDIVTNVANVSNMANEISTASEEQSKGIREITKAVTQMDQVTQANAATSQETASAAEELSAQAVSLKAQVSNLMAAIDGGARTQTAARTVQAHAAAPIKATARPASKTAVVQMKPAAVSASQPASAPAKKMVSGDNYPAPDHKDFEDL